MKYATSSHHAIIINFNCYTYMLLRLGFEKLADKVPLARIAEKRFNNLALRLAQTTSNPELLGPHLFDAVEFHLTDPRLFYNRFEWKINDRMVRSIGVPISSFHAHIEKSPLLGRYTFNLCDVSPCMRKAIRGQLEAAYRIAEAHPKSVVTDNPVIVFHAGLARDEWDEEAAFHRLRENLEFLAATNKRLYEDYGRDRRIIPTIENSPNEGRWLCQTLDDCGRAIRGFSDEVKLTLDYGHAMTVRGGRDALLRQLSNKDIGGNIVSLHMHYSPEVNHEAQHFHAPLSRIPKGNLQVLAGDLKDIVRYTAIKKQGYITLEVPSGDPLDYMPWLGHKKRLAPLVNRFLNGTRLFELSDFRGTMKDQLASLAILKDMLDESAIESDELRHAELVTSVA
ncbi:MAG: TIM barrel protein [Dehalococcoidia bacterium]|nr:TIM barrel protein [Dehalococcoidia bacterium]